MQIFVAHEFRQFRENATVFDPSLKRLRNALTVRTIFKVNNIYESQKLSHLSPIRRLFLRTSDEVRPMHNINISRIVESGHRHDITMIYDRWNHSKAPHKKPPLLSYNIIRPDTNFLDIFPKKSSIQDTNAEV